MLGQRLRSYIAIETTLAQNQVLGIQLQSSAWDTVATKVKHA